MRLGDPSTEALLEELLAGDLTLRPALTGLLE